MADSNNALRDTSLSDLRAVADNPIEPSNGLPSFGKALDIISSAIEKEAKKISQEKTKHWKSLFATWSQDVWQVATPIFKAPAPAPGFDAEGMRSEWEPHWAPPVWDSDKYVAKWKEWADKVIFPQSEMPHNWIPTFEAFIKAVKKTHGAAGFDGWSAEELKLLVKVAPFLMQELYDLWVATTKMAVAHGGDVPLELLELVFPWRVVGIPKKDENESRPIGVASCIVRSWLTALAEALPDVDAEQWACRKKTSVVHAISDWLAGEDDEGAEMDLSKAYDNVDHGVAAEAFRYESVPVTVIATCRMAWRGPRVCCVEGELAQPIWPVKALPQGDSCAPGAMTASLVPWKPAPARGWKFMDDRSLATKGPGAKADLQEGLKKTQEFDESIGFVENAGKRQHWSRDTHDRVEHLGVTCVPSDPQAEVLPRNGWQKIESAIAILGTIPGSMHVRERLAGAYIRPLWLWANPILAVVPGKFTHLLFRAVLRSGCCWWCAGRWWAQRAQLHPQFSAVFQALKAARNTNLVWSNFVHTAVQRHFDAIKVKLVGFDREKGLKIEIHRRDDRRVLKVTAAVRGRGHTFWSNDKGADHAIRAVARIRCLQLTHKSRLDSEGIDDVDVDASSSSQWQKYFKSLDDEQKHALGIYRSGAIKTNTRVRDAKPCKCCGHPWPSARHFWQECPGFQQDRREISEEHKLHPRFWAAQPRVTSKSGWITYAAARSADRRATMQIASCQLGVRIVLRTFAKDGCLS